MAGTFTASGGLSTTEMKLFGNGATPVKSTEDGWYPCGSPRLGAWKVEGAVIVTFARPELE